MKDTNTNYPNQSNQREYNKRSAQLSWELLKALRLKKERQKKVEIGSSK